MSTRKSREEEVEQRYRGKLVLIRQGGNCFHVTVDCSFVQNPPHGVLAGSTERYEDYYFLAKLDTNFVWPHNGKQYFICPECFGRLEGRIK